MWPILSTAIRSETDVVTTRQRARQVAAAVGFDGQDQIRIATAISEVARNAFGYGGGGRAEFAIDPAGEPQALVVTISDRGPGISDVDHVLSGNYRSSTGMGLGLIGARRLMDGVTIDTAPGRGTTVQLRRRLPRRAAQIQQASLAAIADGLAREAPHDPFAELREQNRELIEVSEQLHRQQDELQAVNQELEETNRGVLALYAELEDRASELKRANEARVRFHSNVSHELRTPIQSILAIAQLVLDRVDGELTYEQERQLRYIKSSATTLSGMVDDLLDVAKAEAGKLDLSSSEFTVADLFGGLRGVLRPLRASDAVELVFEDVGSLPPLFTDEAKLNQILRNLLSNALKFTIEGEIRAAANYDAASDRITFRISDTGVGIAPENHERIFEEFAQVPNPLQSRSKGTGLGLSLSRRLAELLGGALSVESSLGQGTTFLLTLPRRLSGHPLEGQAERPPHSIDRLLVIDDDETWRYLMRQMAGALSLDVTEANSGSAGLALAATRRPDVIFLDLAMPDLDGYVVLEQLRDDPVTQHIPVVVMTASLLDDTDRRRLAHAHAVLAKSDVSGGRLTSLLASLREEL